MVEIPENRQANASRRPQTTRCTHTAMEAYSAALASSQVSAHSAACVALMFVCIYIYIYIYIYYFFTPRGERIGDSGS